MTKKSEEKSVADRRDFLKLATVGTVLSGAAIVAGVEANAATVLEAESSGYRETDHIKTYYHLARF